jgi:hypothetical protein
MSVTRRFYWLSFGLLLISCALPSCARTRTSYESDSFQYASAVTELLSKTANLSCDRDSDCQVALYHREPECGLEILYYSTKNISSNAVYSMIRDIDEMLPENMVCTMIGYPTPDYRRCSSLVCQYSFSPF